MKHTHRLKRLEERLSPPPDPAIRILWPGQELAEPVAPSDIVIRVVYEDAPQHGHRPL